MKAAALTSFGGPEVLTLTEVATPQAGPGQLRVRVRSAGVNHFDTAIREGWAPPTVDNSFPVVPGNEYAGVVDQLGEGVTGHSVGDEVFGYCTLGAYAEYVVVSAEQITAKPESLPWDIAGGFSANGVGAHMCLREMKVGPGDTVLIHAAAGALGTFAVQLALAWGASTVIGTASEANHDYLRSMGAVPVTYGDGLVERVRALAPDGVDAALDIAGDDALRASVELVKDKNRIRTMISDELATELDVPAVTPKRSNAQLAELAELHTQGKLRLHIRQALPLAEAAEAHRSIETGHGRGKIVLLVDSAP
ncbi:NADP-dependent oxidoreductase [Streptomyces sp. NPDC047097]|uniref:NADP-dependent oxidoreductase n=1 Tax=Streptomyces sp. NPDC047097 TaxID=3155260 RepID=UPI0033D06133